LQAKGEAQKVAGDAKRALKGAQHRFVVHRWSITAASKPSLAKAGVEPDEGIVPIDERFVQAAGRRYWDREKKIRTLA
jgi:hypothetical protein